MRTVNFDIIQNIMSDNSDITKTTPNAKRDLHRENCKKIVFKVMETDITKRQRKIINMYFFEKKNIPTIASELNINKSTVSRTLKRAILNIRKYVIYYK